MHDTTCMALTHAGENIIHSRREQSRAHPPLPLARRYIGTGQPVRLSQSWLLSNEMSAEEAAGP